MSTLADASLKPREPAVTESPHIVLFSGGSACRNINIALSRMSARLTRIVPAWDSGGSSKVLREAFDMLPVGDVRQGLALDRENDQILGAERRGLVGDGYAHVIDGGTGLQAQAVFLQRSQGGAASDEGDVGMMGKAGCKQAADGASAVNTDFHGGSCDSLPWVREYSPGPKYKGPDRALCAGVGKRLRP